MTLAEAEGADASDNAAADKVADSEFSFLPKILIVQCRSLIESFHELNGYACLPDIYYGRQDTVP